MKYILQKKEQEFRENTQDEVLNQDLVIYYMPMYLLRKMNLKINKMNVFYYVTTFVDSKTL